MPLGSWLAGWNPGETVSLGEFKKGVGLIAESTLSGAAASIDLTGLPTSYAHLMVWMNLKDTAGGAAALAATLRFNNDSGSNYDYQPLTGTGTSVTALEQFAQTSGRPCIYPGTSGTTGSAVLWIPNYAATTFDKTWTSVSFCKVGTGTGNLRNDMNNGAWRSSSSVAINRITIGSGSTSFAIGSRVSVYAFGS